MSRLFYPGTLDLLSHLTWAWEQLFGGQMEIWISSTFQPGSNLRQRHYSHHWIAEAEQQIISSQIPKDCLNLSVISYVLTYTLITQWMSLNMWGICNTILWTIWYLMNNIKISTKRRNERCGLFEVTNFRGQRLRCPSVVILAGLTGGQCGVLQVVRAGGISQCQSVLITLVPGAAALRSSSPPTSPAVGTNTTTTTTTFTEYFTIENMSQVVFMERGTMAPSSWNFL